MSNWWKVVPFLCMIWGCHPGGHPTPSPSPTVEATPSPSSSPSPVVLCPEPLPDKSKLKIQLDCVSGPRHTCDATPIVKGACEYCASIGMGEMGGNIRCSCPMRNEGDPFRLLCEQYVLDFWAPKWVSDGEVSLTDADGFRARTTGSWLKACNVDFTVCSDPGFPN